MSIRQNLATRELVLIDLNNLKKPEDFVRKLPPQGPDKEADCPYCSADQRLQKLAVFPVDGEAPVNVYLNSKPMFSPGAPEPSVKLPGCKTFAAKGTHEVIVDSPLHNRIPALYTQARFRALLQAYKSRFLMNMSLNTPLLILVRNCGTFADAFVPHQCTELMTLPVVSEEVKIKQNNARGYYTATGECVFCKVRRMEVESGERILLDTAHFTSFMVYAGLEPFHLWILPKNHVSSFGAITDEEINDLAAHLKTLLLKFYVGLGNPEYNFVIESFPMNLGAVEAYHWYCFLVPRLNTTSGFVMGSGMHANNVLPEDCAAFIRSVKLQ